MKTEHTSRGFAIAKFSDRYDIECSIQESSLATEACLWLGTKEDRMHLTQGLAAELIPMLQHFVDHGTLPDPLNSRESAPKQDEAYACPLCGVERSGPLAACLRPDCSSVFDMEKALAEPRNRANFAPAQEGDDA